jgi:hypothetical protein
MDPLDWEQDAEEERKIEKWKPTDPENILEDGEMLDVEEIYDQGSEEGEIIERAVVDERRRASIYNSKMGQPQLNNNVPPIRPSGIEYYHQLEPQEANDMELSYKARNPGFVQGPYGNPPQEIMHAGGENLDPWVSMETDSSDDSLLLPWSAPQLPRSVQNANANFQESESESDTTTHPDDKAEPHQPYRSPKKRNFDAIGDVGHAQEKGTQTRKRIKKEGAATSVEKSRRGTSRRRCRSSRCIWRSSEQGNLQ